VSYGLNKICAWLPWRFRIDVWSRRCSSVLMRMLPCMGKISQEINVDGMRPCKDRLPGLSVERVRSILSSWGEGRGAVCCRRRVPRLGQFVRPLSWHKG
jgi:hypothetical protein